MRLFLCCALCALFAFAGPAGAETIILDGGHYDRVNLDATREVIVRGGATIGWLNNMGGVAIIEDGQLETVDTDHRHRIGRGGMLIVKGANSRDTQRLILEENSEQVSTLIIEAIQARMYGSHFIEAILADGQFAQFGLVLRNPETGCHIEFTIRDDLRIDPTGDGLFLLEDLNIVRNNFGAAGDRAQGDTDGDGQVGLSDLNTVRNQFGDPFFLSADQEVRGVVLTPGGAVPEPASVWLAITALGLLITRALPRIACRWWYCWRY